MDKAQKQAFVSELNTNLQDASVVVVAHYRGLTVSKMTDLRSRMRGEVGTVKVAKNRLAKIAFEGTPYTNISELMTGPTALSFSADPVAAAKVAQNFAKDNDDFVILGGAMGETVLDQAGVQALASMPSLDELRGTIVGLLQAPATKIARVSAEPAAKLARVLTMKPE
ncbi:MAG: 50S ribosomal protein L10 [Alphaproteobacteria bacterium]|jgi:large subunit ribosomal protein L10|nr:50S ribosomal protein L10 [Alphaproteobacteria bacterium]